MRLMTHCLALSFCAFSCTQATPEFSSGERQVLPAGSSRLEIELVDAPTQQVKEINVTIMRVTAHSNEVGWVEVFSGGPVTVDLLTLKSQVMKLGFLDLPPGRINQIRLYLQEGGIQNVVLPNGDVAPLKVPSGVQSGIKIKGPFELSVCDATTVQLDFDGHKSIWYHPTGQGGDWILRPVIHTKKVSKRVSSCEGIDAGRDNDSNPPGRGRGKCGHGSRDAGPDDDLMEGPDSNCSRDSECLSGACGGGVCAPGAQGTPCNIGSDCASNTCSTDGTCAGPVEPTLPTGSVCQLNTQCVSGICEAGFCAPALQGQPCTLPTDCAEAFICAAGMCEPQIN